MIITPTRRAGSYVVEPERLEDERGAFMRTYCEREFAAVGIASRVVQCSESYNVRKGTLRGLHFQAPPHGEARLVRCLQGAIFDVMVDLRNASPTFCDWVGVELSSDNNRAVLIPEGYAHGFQTLSADCRVFYQMSSYYHPESAAGYRWDDPTFGIEWPLPDPFMSDRDRNLPLLVGGSPWE